MEEDCHIEILVLLNVSQSQLMDEEAYKETVHLEITWQLLVAFEGCSELFSNLWLANIYL